MLLALVLLLPEVSNDWWNRATRASRGLFLLVTGLASSSSNWISRFSKDFLWYFHKCALRLTCGLPHLGHTRLKESGCLTLVCSHIVFPLFVIFGNSLLLFSDRFDCVCFLRNSVHSLCCICPLWQCRKCFSKSMAFPPQLGTGHWRCRWGDLLTRCLGLPTLQ